MSIKSWPWNSVTNTTAKTHNWATFEFLFDPPKTSGQRFAEKLSTHNPMGFNFAPRFGWHWLWFGEFILATLLWVTIPWSVWCGGLKHAVNLEYWHYWQRRINTEYLPKEHTIIISRILPLWPQEVSSRLSKY